MADPQSPQSWSTTPEIITGISKTDNTSRVYMPSFPCLCEYRGHFHVRTYDQLLKEPSPENTHCRVCGGGDIPSHFMPRSIDSFDALLRDEQERLHLIDELENVLVDSFSSKLKFEPLDDSMRKLKRRTDKFAPTKHEMSVIMKDVAAIGHGPVKVVTYVDDEEQIFASLRGQRQRAPEEVFEATGEAPTKAQTDHSAYLQRKRLRFSLQPGEKLRLSRASRAALQIAPINTRLAVPPPTISSADFAIEETRILTLQKRITEVRRVHQREALTVITGAERPDPLAWRKH